MRIALKLVAVVLLGLSAGLPGSVSSPQTLTPPAATIPASYFGMHMHGAVMPRGYTGKPSPWPDLPFASWRLWDAYVTWANLEPHKGEWHFEVLDRYVQLAQQHRVDILLPLGMSPRWAAARLGGKSPYGPDITAAPPKDLADWRDYIRKVATRYKGKIRHYEIWNEPNGSFFDGSIDEMITLTREARAVLKEIDPDNIVVSPSAVAASGIPWLKEFLSRGGGKYVDVIGYHFYTNDFAPHDPEAMIPIIQQIRRYMADNGLSRMPLWNTETGWYIAGCTPPGMIPSQAHPTGSISQEDAANYVARAYILSWAAGVARFYWYAWDNLTFGLIDCDGRTLKPAARAYSETRQWLVGSRIVSCRSDSNGVWVCSLMHNGAPQLLVWTRNGTATYLLPRDLRPRFVISLNGKRTRVNGLTIHVGPMPQLVE
jgi:hypothetical protein